MNLKETKKSIKEEIDRPTWSKWVVNNIHHIEYFFNGKIVDKKMLNSLFESEGFDTDVDMVEDEIKKAVRSVRLGNLDGKTLGSFSDSSKFGVKSTVFLFIFLSNSSEILDNLDSV